MTDATTTSTEIGALTARQRVNRGAVAAVAALLPAWSVSFAESSRGAVLTLVTAIVLLAVLATIDRSALIPARAGVATVVLYLVLAAAGLVAFVFHPSGAGAILTFSIVVPVGVVLSTAGYSIDGLRRYVALPLLITTALQAVLVAAQTATESAVGYSLLHPGAELLVTNETIVRPQGTYDHVYEPAAVALIAVAVGLALLPGGGRLRTVFLVGIGAATTTIALTHSRSALLGLILVFVIAAVAFFRGQAGLGAAVAVLLVTLLIPALLTADAWSVRYDESATGDLDDASLGRITLARQAIEIAADHPVVGVGPNRYMDVLETDYTVDERYPYVVHNESLMIGAELGIPAGIVITVLFVWAGVQAIRADYRSVLLYAAPVPFFVFDVLLYNKPVGLLLFALWCGVAASLVLQSRMRLRAPDRYV